MTCLILPSAADVRRSEPHYCVGRLLIAIQPYLLDCWRQRHG